MKNKIDKSNFEEAVAETVSENVTEEINQVSELIPEEKGVWIYIGPNVRGIATNGSIFFGTKSSVLEKLPADWKKYPQIERLIVSDAAVARAREQISEGKGGISVAYNTVAAAVLSAAESEANK